MQFQRCCLLRAELGAVDNWRTPQFIVGPAQELSMENSKVSAWDRFLVQSQLILSCVAGGPVNGQHTAFDSLVFMGLAVLSCAGCPFWLAVLVGGVASARWALCYPLSNWLQCLDRGGSTAGAALCLWQVRTSLTVCGLSLEMPCAAAVRCRPLCRMCPCCCKSLAHWGQLVWCWATKLLARCSGRRGLSQLVPGGQDSRRVGLGCLVGCSLRRRSGIS